MGAQGHYLVDFYHTGKYVGNAANKCAGEGDAQIWIEQQKNALKSGQLPKVIEALEPHQKFAKLNLVNTYVWTADGGLYAESTEFTEVKPETTSTFYDFAGMAGA